MEVLLFLTIAIDCIIFISMLVYIVSKMLTNNSKDLMTFVFICSLFGGNVYFLLNHFS